VPIAFDGYTAAGRLEGQVVADPRLADLLATFTSVIVEAPSFAPIAGSLAESASYVAPGTPWTSVEVDDLFVVAAAPETVIPFHAAWHKVTLDMSPYVVQGELPSLPGFDPERALARPRGGFVLLARVRIGLDIGGAGAASPLRELTYAWINRYAVDRVESDLDLSRFFPGAGVAVMAWSSEPALQG
jgi:hypothetical protein